MSTTTKKSNSIIGLYILLTNYHWNFSRQLFFYTCMYIIVSCNWFCFFKPVQVFSSHLPHICHLLLQTLVWTKGRVEMFLFYLCFVENLRKLWKVEHDLLKRLYPSIMSADMEYPTDLFFIDVVPVPATKFRPVSNCMIIIYIYLLL